MKFEFRKEINKDFILSQIPEEQIMEYYTHIPVRKGLFVSKIREDHKPTVAYYRNSKGELIYKDFATGQHLNIFAVVQEVCKCDYFKALHIIANDFGLIKNDKIKTTPGVINYHIQKLEEKRISKIQVEIQPFSELELKWWAKYGITPEILKHFNVFSCKHVFLNGKLMFKSQQHCPIYGYYGGTIKKDGEKIELWRCYFPKRKDYRWITNWPAKKIQGLNYLPESGKLLVITKSLKDVMCFYSLGIPACAPNSETQFIHKTVLEKLKQRFKYIFVLYDLDSTGIQFSKKIKKEHPEITVTLLPRTGYCKDISDYYAKYGRDRTQKMIFNKLKLFSKTPDK